MQHTRRAAVATALGCALATSGAALAADGAERAPGEHARAGQPATQGAAAARAANVASDTSHHQSPPAPAPPTRAEVNEQLAPASPPSQVRLEALTEPQVSALQARLTALGYAPGSVDGIAGDGTRAALRRFFRAQAELAARGVLTDTGALLLGIERSAGASR